MSDSTKKAINTDKITEFAVISGFFNFKVGILKNNLLLQDALKSPIRQIPKYQKTNLKNAPAIIAWGRKKATTAPKK